MFVGVKDANNQFIAIFRLFKCTEHTFQRRHRKQAQGSGSYVKEEKVNYDIYQLTSLYEKLADRNVDTRSEQEIIPVVPSEEVVKALGIDASKPILEKVSCGYLKDGRVFEFSRNIFKSDDDKFTWVARRKH